VFQLAFAHDNSTRPKAEGKIDVNLIGVTFKDACFRIEKALNDPGGTSGFCSPFQDHQIPWAAEKISRNRVDL
jgi:hypothetical protein